MFIKTTKSKGYEYLYLVEEVYKAGKKKTITVKKLGRVDLLSPEAVQDLRERYRCDSRYTLASVERNVKELLPFMMSPAKANTGANDDEQSDALDWEQDDKNEAPALHYGHLVVKHIWINTLGLNRTIGSLQKEHLSKLSFQLSSVGYFLCASKMMEPSSYLGIYDQNDAFLANPISSVSLDLIYQSLGYLGRFKDQIMKSAYNNLSKTFGLSKPKLLFFDCTNFYFETQYDSKESFIIDFHKNATLNLMNEGIGYAAIQQHLLSKEFIDELNKAVEEAEAKGQFTRMRGPSKESRFAQPLMGMALVIDEHGFPLDFELYPGNKSEFSYLRSSVTAIKEKYGITDAFYVADRGINSSQNLKFIQDNQLGFIVAQKISQQTSEQRDEMLSPEGWKSIDFSVDPWAVQLFDDIDSAQYRYKVCDCTKDYYEYNEDADDKGRKLKKGRRRKLQVNCKIIYTFSEKRRRRDLCVLDAMVSRAQTEIASGKFAGNPCSVGWRSLLRTAADIKKGEDKEQYRFVGLNEDKIRQLKEIAGYAALVYSAPANHQSAEDLEPLELAAQKGYKQLVSIEACFRTAKSSLNLRPVYLRRDDRTLGHCLICILSLIMLKAIQYNLKLKDFSIPLARIQDALNQAMVLAIPSALDPEKAIFINHRKPKRDTAAERKQHKTAQQSQVRSLTNLIVKSVGLSPLNFIEIERNIRLRLKVDPKVPLLSSRQQEELTQLASKSYK